MLGGLLIFTSEKNVSLAKHQTYSYFREELYHLGVIPFDLFCAGILGFRSVRVSNG